MSRFPLRVASLVAVTLMGLGVASAQVTTPPPGGPPAAAAPGPDGQARPRRPAMVTLDYGQLNRGQQRRVQQALAGRGNTPVAADQAEQRWNAMDQRQRRQAMRTLRDQTPRRPATQTGKPTQPPPNAPPPPAATDKPAQPG